MGHLAFPFAPIFVLTLVVLEVVLSALDDIKKVDLKDSLANLTIGFFIVVMNLLFNGTTYAILGEINVVSFFHLNDTWYMWLILFLICDLLHYSFHYLEHQIRVLWSLHSMHHSSNYYNLTTALRSQFGNPFYKLCFHAPLCFAGFSPLMVVTVDTIILLYGFLVHTEHIKKLGFLELVLNTPSHHRVHHGSNEKYIDKNFGSVLILWDKVFGTFEPEVEPPTYGLVKPLRSYNPLTIMFHESYQLANDVANSKRWKQRFCQIFGKPGIQIEYKETPKKSRVSEKIKPVTSRDQLMIAKSPVSHWLLNPTK